MIIRLHIVLLVIIFSYSCCSVVCGQDKKYLYETKWIEVPVDHFSFARNDTFKIRYLINDTFVSSKEMGPIFFYTGNEGDIELFAENTGFMWEAGEEMDALIIFAEHRYYGQSLPFGNKSFDTPEHRGYLTSEQALADYAQLLNQINPVAGEHPPRPVIAFGGSYGGMLAAWFRMKYPHMVQGSIASSAPIRQFKNLTGCQTFNRILSSVFTTANNEHCSENIRNSWKTMEDLAGTDEGLKTLNTKFKFCKNFTKSDLKNFTDYLTDVYGNLAMVNYPYETTFLAPLPPNPVHQFCKFLDKKYNGTELIDQLERALSVYTNYTGQISCLNFSSAYDSRMGDSGWDYQACTEMVMPMCSDGILDMFPKNAWDYQKYSDECYAKYKVRPRDEMAINNYGGKYLLGVSNIVFSNGLLDPWSGGGVLGTDNDKILIVLIPNGAHHLDLRARNPADPSSVTGVRTIHKNNIRKWILEYWQNINWKH